MSAHLKAIREHAGDMLKENQFDGRAAVILGHVANAEREMARLKRENSRLSRALVDRVVTFKT